MIYLTYELIRGWFMYESPRYRDMAPWFNKMSQREKLNFDFAEQAIIEGDPPIDPWEILFGADEENQAITCPKTILISPTLSNFPDVVDCHGPNEVDVKLLRKAYMTVEITFIVGGPQRGGPRDRNPKGFQLPPIRNLMKGHFQTAVVAAGITDLLLMYSGDPLSDLDARREDHKFYDTFGMEIDGHLSYLRGRIIETEFLSEQWGVADPGPTPVFITKTFRCLVERGPFGE